ncbi:MAG: GreA/GreB family elongation factor [Crocinitomicaceae bacterium]|nr:GreA/GreB family elongation factor [Crocinitomicaceae bacterium]
MNTKEKLYQLCKEIVDQRLDEISKDIEDVQHSVNTETKNTTGDKHDTSRAMMQLEVEQKSKHLVESMKLKETLGRFSPKTSSTTAGLGSIVETSTAKYFISVSVGKLVIDEGMYFAISTASPIGELLMGKKAGDEFEFNGQKMKIVSVK